MRTLALPALKSASHLRVEDPLLSHILFPTYVAALLWVGLVLRDARLRSLLR